MEMDYDNILNRAVELRESSSKKFFPNILHL